MFSLNDNKCFKQLDRLMNTIFDASSSENTILNVRSHLGKTLHFCCIQDSRKTLDIIIKRMESIKVTPGISIILLACASFVLKYIPTDSFVELSNWITGPLLRHAVSSDGNHIFNLVQFFGAGGTKLLPFPDVFLGELLLHSENIGINSAKPIAYLIDINPDAHSSIFWSYFRDINSEQFLNLLCKVVSHGNLIPPKDKNLLSSMINMCEKLLDENCQFHEIEKALTILRWLVVNKCYRLDKIFPTYKNSGLNAIVVDCWAEYASYGDLSKIPKFTLNEPNIYNIYIKLIRNASLNPNFTFSSIDVPHWLWDEILIEFAKKSPMNESKEKNYSLYDLGNNELIYCADIAYILPVWFFQHCLRFRCKNSETASKILKIVGEMSSCIILENTNFQDFISFIEHHLLFPQNADIIAEVLRKHIYALLPRMNPLLEMIVNSIDYFDELNLTPRLIVLNSIFCFGVETESFLDIFDNLWECIPFITLSLSLSEAIFTFFSLITPFVPSYANSIFNFALAPLSAFCDTSVTGDGEPNCVKESENAHVIYNSCLKFFSIVSSDIVTNPNYSLQSSYPLTKLGLLTIKKIPQSMLNQIFIANQEGLYSLIEYLPLLITIVPQETLAVSMIFIDLLNEQQNINNSKIFNKNKLKKLYKKKIQFVIDYLVKELRFKNAEILYLFSLPFKNKIETFLKKETAPLTSDNFKIYINPNMKLNESFDTIRLLLSLDSKYINLILNNIQYLSILIELWVPRVDHKFLELLASKALASNSWNESRVIRAFLAHFNYKQPEYCVYDSWLHREFCHSNDHLFTSLVFETKYDTFENVMNEFSKNYPVNLKLETNELLLSIVKTYRSNSELIKPLCYILSTNIEEMVFHFKNKFWFIRFLFNNKFQFKFPNDSIENEKCIAFGIRNKFFPISKIINENYTTDLSSNLMPQNSIENNETNLSDSFNNNDTSLTSFNMEDDIASDYKYNYGQSILENPEMEDWMKIELFYSIPSSIIESIWSKISETSLMLFSKFIPKSEAISEDLILRLINSTTPSIMQHVLDYFIGFTSNTPEDVIECAISPIDSAIFAFSDRIDLNIPVLFENFQLFVSSLCMSGIYQSFSHKIADIFLKNVFCFETGTSAACVFETLPILSHLVSGCFDLKLKSNETVAQFLKCLKQGLPSIGEFIPDLPIE